jgi:hypothetical protein
VLISGRLLLGGDIAHDAAHVGGHGLQTVHHRQDETTVVTSEETPRMLVDIRRPAAACWWWARWSACAYIVTMQLLVNSGHGVAHVDGLLGYWTDLECKCCTGCHRRCCGLAEQRVRLVGGGHNGARVGGSLRRSNESAALDAIHGSNEKSQMLALHYAPAMVLIVCWLLAGCCLLVTRRGACECLAGALYVVKICLSGCCCRRGS